MIARVMDIGDLDHPAIVPIKFVCLGRYPKVVTPFFWSSLKAVLAAPTDWWTANAKAITVVGIAAGIECLHSQAISHKDLRPANVLFDAENRHPHVTGLVSFARTSYAAPEPDPNEKADVYAFGLILYEIVVGGSHLGSRVIPGDIKTEVRTLIQRCTAPKPNDRPAFARIVRELAAIDYCVVPGVGKAEVSKYVASLGATVSAGLLMTRSGPFFATRVQKPPDHAWPVIAEQPPTELDLSFTDGWPEEESESDSEDSGQFRSRIPTLLCLLE
jgi:serine/threonine protein kinase